MKIDILFKSPCVVFTLSDIFEPSVIEACLDHFPMDKNLFQSDEGGKHRIEHYSRAMAKLLSQSAHWRSVFRRLSADDILSCLNHLEIAEGREPRRYAWESLNPIVNFVNRHIGQKQLVRQTIEFSLLDDGAFLVPHTDSKNKILTMMLYVPEQKQCGSGDYGTAFHDFANGTHKKYENFGNIHFNEKDFPDFHSDSRIIFRTPFSKGVLYGFLKNSHSWHSVPKINLLDGEYRRSVNINVYAMNESIISTLWARIKRIIKNH